MLWTMGPSLRLCLRCKADQACDRNRGRGKSKTGVVFNGGWESGGEQPPCRRTSQRRDVFRQEVSTACGGETSWFGVRVSSRGGEYIQTHTRRLAVCFLRIHHPPPISAVDRNGTPAARRAKCADGHDDTACCKYHQVWPEASVCVVLYCMYVRCVSHVARYQRMYVCKDACPPLPPVCSPAVRCGRVRPTPSIQPCPALPCLEPPALLLCCAVLPAAAAAAAAAIHVLLRPSSSTYVPPPPLSRLQKKTPAAFSPFEPPVVASGRAGMALLRGGRR